MNIVRQEIRTGLLVVVSLGVLITVMLYLGSPGVFVKQKTFYVFLDNASGLKQGAEVALAGRKIGQITRVTSPVPEANRPDPKKEVLIEVQVNRNAKIYNHVNVFIAQNGLLGELFIDFTSGAESSGEAPDGAHFLGAKPPGLDQAVPLVLEKLDPALKKATETLDSLQKTADNLTKLTAPDGAASLMMVEMLQTGKNLDSITAPEGTMNRTLANVNSLIGPQGKMEQALANIAELTASTGSFAKSMQHAEKFTGDLASNKNLNLTLENSRRATAELTTTLTELRAKFGTIAGNLEQATDTVKRQPWRLIYPSTKKYPEESKVDAAAQGAAQAAEGAAQAARGAEKAARAATPRRKQ